MKNSTNFDKTIKNIRQRPAVYAIIAAAGLGTRANFNENKLFKQIFGKPLILKTAEVFLIDEIDKVIISVNENDIERMQGLFLHQDKITFVIGGKRRQDSVKAALDTVDDDAIVLIHDGARAYVSRKVILDCISTVEKYGSAVAAVPAVDTTCAANCGYIDKYYDRQSLYLLQTPQGFYASELKRAYEMASDKDYTDDSSIYAEFIKKPKLFLSDTKNIKFTYKEDFKDFMNMYTGIGFDTHRLVKDRKLILGGVEIPSELGLLGHSDADALTHAIMDALLSSAGLKDIGCHFPDTDERYKDLSSICLLKEVVKKLQSMNLKIKNVSAVIVAQQPKLSPYIDQMTENLAKVMHISTDCVGITTSTAEQMGFIGRSEGIAVTASCLTYKDTENDSALED